MSELIQKSDSRATIRWKLLTGTSVLALAACVSTADLAHADDANRPLLRIELGGQLNRLGDAQESFAPTFPNSPPRPSIFSPSENFERPPLYSFDEFANLAFQPAGSDLVFSGTIRYGRSAANRHFNQRTNPEPFVKYYYSSLITGPYLHGTRHRQANRLDPKAEKFADTESRNSEQHAILDFSAGKDVGLGLFGSTGASTVSLGVRFAQFASNSNIALKSNPDWHFQYKYLPILLNFGRTSSKFAFGSNYHSNAANLRVTRSFHGVGPSLSWTATAPFAGNLQDGELTIDWSVNAALLFGRQRTKAHHQTTGSYHGYKYTSPARHITFQPAPFDKTRSRNVTVPNLGGSVGLSWQLQNFKMSLGYRADFFFNAMDGGIDKRKDENRAFFGPYASISIGIGD